MKKTWRSHSLTNHRASHYVVIVLGLGEALPFYTLITKNWETKYGVTPILYTVGWKTENEPFETKLSQLVQDIKKLATSENSISLVGISAGASAALNAYVMLKKRGVKIHSYVSICGRFNYQSHPWYPLSYGVQRVPVFDVSVAMAMKNVRYLTAADYRRISCFSAFFDEVAPRSASRLVHSTRFTIPLIQHHLSIYGLLIAPRKLITQLTEGANSA